MKNYEKPQIILEKFEVEDIMKESGVHNLLGGITELSIEHQEKFSDLKFN
ncbi:MAG: hypothetical protein IK057_01415 [Clostridia bacterium]|nr:hypothetical protein [Clostridia bacterium]